MATATYANNTLAIEKEEGFPTLSNVCFPKAEPKQPSAAGVAVRSELYAFRLPASVRTERSEAPLPVVAAFLATERPETLGTLSNASLGWLNPGNRPAGTDDHPVPFGLGSVRRTGRKGGSCSRQEVLKGEIGGVSVTKRVC